MISNTQGRSVYKRFSIKVREVQDNLIKILQDLNRDSLEPQSLSFWNNLSNTRATNSFTSSDLEVLNFLQDIASHIQNLYQLLVENQTEQILTRKSLLGTLKFNATETLELKNTPFIAGQFLDLVQNIEAQGNQFCNFFENFERQDFTQMLKDVKMHGIHYDLQTQFSEVSEQLGNFSQMLVQNYNNWQAIYSQLRKTKKIIDSVLKLFELFAKDQEHIVSSILENLTTVSEPNELDGDTLYDIEEKTSLETLREVVFSIAKLKAEPKQLDETLEEDARFNELLVQYRTSCNRTSIQVVKQAGSSLENAHIKLLEYCKSAVCTLQTEYENYSLTVKRISSSTKADSLHQTVKSALECQLDLLEKSHNQGYLDDADQKELSEKLINTCTLLLAHQKTLLNGESNLDQPQLNHIEYYQKRLDTFLQSKKPASLMFDEFIIWLLQGIEQQRRWIDIQYMGTLGLLKQRIQTVSTKESNSTPINSASKSVRVKTPDAFFSKPDTTVPVVSSNDEVLPVSPAFSSESSHAPSTPKL